MLRRGFGQHLVASSGGPMPLTLRNVAKCVRRGLVLIFASISTGEILAFKRCFHTYRSIRFFRGQLSGQRTSGTALISVLLRELAFLADAE